MENVKVAYCHYEIPAAGGRPARIGALLRMDFPQVGVGYADLHPWTELGDPSLTKLLADISHPETHQLLRAAFAIARWDAEARSRQESLSAGLKLPQSHLLLTTLEWKAAEVSLRIGVEQGFRRVKLKIGFSPLEEAKFLNRQSEDYPDLLWRLDANSRFLSAKEWNSWWERLSPEVKSRIDFIEDPLPPDQIAQLANTADQRGFELACDFGFSIPNINYETAVVKVSRRVWQEVDRFISPSHRVVLTHALGHPLGWVSDLLFAAQFYRQNPGREEVCGLQWRGLVGFEEWTERIRWRGPETEYRAELGLGFGDLLRNLKWQSA